MSVRRNIKRLRRIFPPGWTALSVCAISTVLGICFPAPVVFVVRDPFIVLGVLLGMMAYGMVVRKYTHGRVFTPNYSDARFFERYCSGCSHRTPLHIFGGARRCLWVAVTDEEILTGLTFPFNALLSFEFWGLEHRIAASQVLSVAEAFFGGTTIRFRNRDGWREAFTVWCKDKSKLIAAIESVRSSESIGAGE